MVEERSVRLPATDPSERAQGATRPTLAERRDRRLRAAAASVVGGEGGENVLYRQPLAFLAAKAAVGALLAACALACTPLLGGAFERGFAFFKLPEIYNFAFPAASAFQRLAFYLLFALTAYHLARFVARNLYPALFSALIVDHRTRRVIYLEQRLFGRTVHQLRVQDISAVALEQGPLGRRLGLGTLVFHDRQEGRMLVSSLADAADAVRAILAAQHAGRDDA